MFVENKNKKEIWYRISLNRLNLRLLNYLSILHRILRKTVNNLCVSIVRLGHVLKSAEAHCSTFFGLIVWVDIWLTCKIHCTRVIEIVKTVALEVKLCQCHSVKQSEKFMFKKSKKITGKNAEASSRTVKLDKMVINTLSCCQHEQFSAKIEH